MRKLVGKILLTIAVSMIAFSSNAVAIDTILPPEKLAASPLIISAYYIAGTSPGYFELYNSSNDIINLRDFSLQLKWNVNANTAATTQPLLLALQDFDSFLPSKQYVVVAFGDTAPDATIQFDGVSGSTGTSISEIGIVARSFKPYVKQFTTVQTQRMMLGETSTGYTTTGTYALDVRTAIYDNGSYTPSRSDFPLAPVEVLANPRTCSPTEQDLACHEYIKFFNDTAEVVDFANTRLRIGYQGQTATASNTIALSGTINPGEYAVFDHAEDGSLIGITNTGGYVWLEDAFGLVTYPSSVVSYSDASSDTHKGQSWAIIGGVWQWAQPNPAGENTVVLIETTTVDASSDFAPCRADQYRSPETNRCRNIETTATPVACDDGEYRNPDTGRCKKVASSATTSLQPCDEGQYRNPDTNRCKSIASQTSSVTPCQSGWERNPETNRCRKIPTSLMPAADFAVTKFEQSNTSGLGWLAFAGVGAGLTGYGIWEWRSDFFAIGRRLFAKRVP